MGLSCSSARMCKLSVQEPLLLPRAQAWCQAFRYINKDAVAHMVDRALEASRRLPAATLEHPNVREFLETEVSKWFLTCAEVFFVKSSEEEELGEKDGKVLGTFPNR